MHCWRDSAARLHLYNQTQGKGGVHRKDTVRKASRIGEERNNDKYTAKRSKKAHIIESTRTYIRCKNTEARTVPPPEEKKMNMIGGGH